MISTYLRDSSRVKVWTDIEPPYQSRGGGTLVRAYSRRTLDSRVESCTAPPSILRTATCRRARAKLSRSSRNSRSPRSRSNLSAVRGEMVPAKYPGYSNRKHTIPSAQSFRLSHCGNVASHQTDFCQLEF